MGYGLIANVLLDKVADDPQLRGMVRRGLARAHRSEDVAVAMSEAVALYLLGFPMELADGTLMDNREVIVNRKPRNPHDRALVSEFIDAISSEPATPDVDR